MGILFTNASSNLGPFVREVSNENSCNFTRSRWFHPNHWLLCFTRLRKTSTFHYVETLIGF